MLKKLKKYSLFLILTVFFGLLNIDGVKAITEIKIGSYNGEGYGAGLESGDGIVVNVTNPRAIGDNGMTNNQNNPGIRVTAMKKNGTVVGEYLDVLTYDVDPKGNNNSSAFGRLVSSVGNTYFGNTNGQTFFEYKDATTKEEVTKQLYKKIEKSALISNSEADEQCWSFISGCKQTLGEDFYYYLKKNKNVRYDILKKIGIMGSDNKLKSGYTADDIFLVIEPIIVYGIKSQDSNGNYVDYPGTNRYWYGTAYQLKNDNSWPYHSVNTFKASQSFFWTSYDEIKAYMSTGAANNIKNNYGLMVNIISLAALDEPEDSTMPEYTWELVNPNSMTCSTTDKTLTWKTITSKTGERTTNLNKYNEKWGKKTNFGNLNTDISDCRLYCKETIKIKLPKLLSTTVNAGNKFKWITNESTSIIQTMTCKYLPYKDGGLDINSTDYSYTAYNKCLEKDLKKYLNNVNNILKINASYSIYYQYDDSKSVEIFYGDYNTASGSLGINSLPYTVKSSNIDYGTINKCSSNDSISDCRKKAESRTIVMTKEYNMIGNGYKYLYYNNGNIEFDKTTPSDKNLTPISNAGDYSYLYLPETAFENKEVGYTKSFDIKVNFYRMYGKSGFGYNQIVLNSSDLSPSSRTTYTCSYKGKKPFCNYKLKTNYNPAICTESGKNNNGSYNVTTEKNSCNLTDYNLDVDNQQYGAKYSNNLGISDCTLYCKETVNTKMPGNLNETVSIGSRFEWIKEVSDYDNFKLKVETKLECKYLPSQNDEVNSYKACANNIANIVNGQNVINTIENKIIFDFDYEQNQTASFNLEKVSGVENAYSSGTFNTNCSSLAACKNSLRSVSIVFTKVDSYAMPDSPELYSSRLNGVLITGKPTDYTNSLYNKIEKGLLYVPKNANVTKKYDLKLKIENLGTIGFESNALVLNNTSNVLNQNSEQTQYTCNYTPSNEPSCLCPEGTKHEGESPYEYSGICDDGTLGIVETYACTEAQLLFCDSDTNSKDECSCIDSSGVLHEKDYKDCLADNNTKEFCRKMVGCDSDPNLPTYTCKYENGEDDITSCVQGQMNAGKSLEKAKEYCTNINPRCCKYEGTCPEDNVVYRTIDLNNPFPGKDGKTRIPGSNWNSLTLIKNKITDTSGVYAKEPIYKITLTPSTIKKIREYNDNHDYLDYENLNCNDDDVACISSFLDSDILTVTGECSNATKYNFYTCLHYDDNTNNVY